MMNYITYNKEGVLTGFYQQDLVDDHASCYIEVGEAFIENWINYKLVDGEFVLRSVTIDIQSEKKKASDAINQWRATANQSHFNFDGKQIRCDALSRSDLDGIANYVNLLNEFPAGFPKAWKALDNTYVSLPEVEDFKELYAAMVDQGNANFLKAQQIKQQLAQASTLEAVEAVTKLLESEHA